MSSFDWSELYRHRKQIAARFGDIWALPIEKRYHTILNKLGNAAPRVLEVGAGDRRLKLKLEQSWGG